MLVTSSKISHWAFWTFNRRCSTQNSLLLRKEFNKLENVHSASNSGYCVTDKMELDKTFLAPDKNNGVHNCCDQRNVEKGYLCFEHLEGFDIQALKAAMHFSAAFLLEKLYKASIICVKTMTCMLRPVLDNKEAFILLCK
ncbi:uncharacterized protein LOC100680461 isoform X2 [Nasonia vitripennis]|uniref:Uncharacterized protein n=1 Tax=Nasonia vitripennis TaxID=7425 RepID=A0A7M7PYF0_NASVI|nr:uncharacterized protein LOC100680461 isoform X2 [Nasonia vitripennis]